MCSPDALDGGSFFGFFGLVPLWVMAILPKVPRRIDIYDTGKNIFHNSADRIIVDYW